MSKPKVLLLGDILHAKEKWRSLSSIADLIKPVAANRSAFIDECKSGRFNGVTAMYHIPQSVSITGPVDANLISFLPKSLKFIAQNAAGYDEIDIAACTTSGIRIANTSTVVDKATADVNMFLILGALRGFNASILTLRDQKWRNSLERPLGHDPDGKVLGILGMGGIGRNVKRKAEAFGMRVIYHNRTRLSEEMAGGAEYVSFDELLARSDVLSLNLPLNENTHHIISTPEFTKMKRGIIIVNTARGAIIDEKALVEALESGQVWSAGLDVYEEEPKVHPRLLANPHVMLLTHMGTCTIETKTAMEEWTIENVRAALERGEMNCIVPEQVNM